MDNTVAGSTIPRPDGLVLAPFRATRYDPNRVELSRVLAPPYDVIDDDEREALATRELHNVVRLTLPRSDGGDAYVSAREAFTKWRAEEVLRADPTPALYVYEERSDGHVQRG